jgi:Ca-activated chloride channel family protein
MIRARPLAHAPLALAAVLSLVAASAASAQTLRIVKPQHLSTVLGPTTIELEVAAPGGVSIERVELLLDGAPLATLAAPPWRVDFDAGDGSRGHRIEAALHLGDGRVIRDLIRTSALRIDEEIAVDLVNVYPLVLDASGAYVTGLAREDFRVFENGELQTLQRFTTEQRPLRVAIVLDTSLSMARGDRIEDAKKAALGFLDMLQPQDDALVVTFADEVKVAQEVTRDRALLAAAIGRAEALGGTALYDAIWRTARRLEEFDGRRVMVLLSDGKDEAANGFEPGSLHTLDEARLQALRGEVMIFAIGLGKNLDREYAREWTRSTGTSDTGVSLKAILEGLAIHTGGRLLLSPSPSKLVKAFGDVAGDLRHQYSLAYAPSNDAKDGKYRRIEVTVPARPDVQIIVRQGYFAEGS